LGATASWLDEIEKIETQNPASKLDGKFEQVNNEESLSDIDIIRQKYMNIFANDNEKKNDSLGSS